jgi:hypothetical protein
VAVPASSFWATNPKKKGEKRRNCYKIHLAIDCATRSHLAITVEFLIRPYAGREHNTASAALKQQASAGDDCGDNDDDDDDVCW